MTRLWALLVPAILLFAGAGQAFGQESNTSNETSIETSGHIKLQLLSASYPEDSWLREAFGASSLDSNLDLRLDLSLRRARLDLKADVQAIGLYGDTIESTRDLNGAGSPLLTGRYTDDDLRLFDLTRVLTDRDRFAGLTRFDRLSIGYTGSKTVVRFGRQAVSWGNGFLYNPMDIFNPFDPTAVDKEYKTGDDMLYTQFLAKRGDDLQGVVVFRRDPVTGDVASDRSSAALKYHRLIGVGEIDLLVAEHFGDAVVGLGGNRSFGGAVWRGDLMLARTDHDTVASLVTSLSYSFIVGGKNTSGALEYYYNGFGQGGGSYSPEQLARNPELVTRVTRDELFNLGRHYLAASATVELTPLFLLTPNLFVNTADPSALLQVVTQNDLAQNLVLQGALAIPFGGQGTEFGGIEAEMGRYLSNDASVFVQLAWYF